MTKPVVYRTSESLRMYVRDDGLEAHETTAIIESPLWRMKQTDGFENGFKRAPTVSVKNEVTEVLVPSDFVDKNTVKTVKGKFVIDSKVE